MTVEERRDLSAILSYVDQWNEEILARLEEWAAEGKLLAMVRTLAERTKDDDPLSAMLAVFGLIGMSKIFETYADRTDEKA